jgi:molybdopterin synthase catalytic subunit
MKIIFQKESFLVNKKLEKFSKANKAAGSIISFVGKVRPTNNYKKIVDIDIEIYEKMALIQMKKIVLELKKKFKILDYLVIHRFGNIKPHENILLIIVASKHRKDGFRFTEDLVDWLKVKITFWKKENYLRSSKWIEQKKTDRKILKPKN